MFLLLHCVTIYSTYFFYCFYVELLLCYCCCSGPGVILEGTLVDVSRHALTDVNNQKVLHGDHKTESGSFSSSISYKMHGYARLIVKRSHTVGNYPPPTPPPPFEINGWLAKIISNVLCKLMFTEPCLFSLPNNFFAQILHIESVKIVQYHRNKIAIFCHLAGPLPCALCQTSTHPSQEVWP